MQDIIDAINAAEDNEQLSMIAKDLLGVEIQKRRKLETNQDILLKEVDRRANEGAPAVTDEGENEAAPKAIDKKPRMLRNKKTGVLFAWTPALAKLDHMAETED